MRTYPDQLGEVQPGDGETGSVVVVVVEVVVVVVLLDVVVGGTVVVVVVGGNVVVVVVVVVGAVCPAMTTLRWSTVVAAPRTVRLSV